MSGDRTSAERRRPLRALAERRRPLLRAALALALGTAGGAAFAWLDMPLPWMLGAMALSTLAALLSLPVSSPMAVRPPMSAVLGVLLGAAFTPELFSQVLRWGPTIAGLAVFVATAGAAATLYFRYVARMDWTTAYFAGMPGGLVEMVLAAEDRGGDTRTIALIHSARVFLIVFAIPFLVGILEGGLPRGGGFSKLEPGGFGLADLAWLVGCAAGGLWLGRRLRLPAAPLMGPLILSAAAHGAGLTTFVPPDSLVATAQVVIGTTIGCRFLGTPARRIVVVLAYSLGATAIFAAFTLAFAFALGWLTGMRPAPIVLAYSPGGVAEMGLIALALQVEIAFVTVHHILRLIMVMAFAPALFRLLGPKRGG
ncbi:AbrB family transcriptional regulator [Aquibium sp. A9E412]|uniref:AbrB family transcriptional regulator n=1 Tax=Aquibium sp. A9E412 TaxID=2976767 RepID=UPI0025B10B3F|nr:AbrB family transcriptional regulator [Aquibium sp. A9E412]MDN2565543.1 AbrB family transcriptional regulator [Aquibium sp. A9E412]